MLVKKDCENCPLRDHCVGDSAELFKYVRREYESLLRTLTAMVAISVATGELGEAVALTFFVGFVAGVLEFNDEHERKQLNELWGELVDSLPFSGSVPKSG